MNTLTTTNAKPNSLSSFMQKAKAKAEANKGRLIFGFDATASRSSAWTTAKELQANMFAAVKRLDVQLAVYRGTELLISSWEDDPEKLRDLMNQITCEGGNTQIERMLQHVFDENKKKTVNAFVFIGDTIEEQEPKLLALVKALGEVKVPGFFFLEKDAMSYKDWSETYRKMAELTGGAFAPFDANATKFLADLLSAVGAYAAGGIAALTHKDSPAARLLLSQMKKD